MNLPVIILGGGGHAKVLIDTLQKLDREIIGISDPYLTKQKDFILGIDTIGDDNDILKYPSHKVELVNGLGTVTVGDRRFLLFEKFKKLGYNFASVIHPSVIIASEIQLGEGVQIMAGAIIQPSCQIGNNTIVNTKVSVDHDCVIGSHVHIAPGVTLSGNVNIGDKSHIGTGAIIIQGINIGKNSLVGAGAVVIKDVEDNCKVVGNPAKKI